ncbi:MAG TPA: LacI family DNA-binding transcriptional regulator [Candidatus Dormibacteraeota bacterium]|jgi:LacI family transcriptional regulator|nr:LacI family DNA-binding transcriptional regulator [Candidatus Dormibacteraeota bacterium]
MGRAPTLSDVAGLAGVSMATASRALTGTRRVDTRLRERVLAAARELGYAPNPHARALARAGDASIGVVVHDLTDPYFSEIVRGVLAEAEAQERMVLICNTWRDPDRELAYVASFRAQRLQTLVLAGSGVEDRRLGARMAAQIAGFEAAGGRAVLIGRHHAPADAVVPDNLGGGRLLAEELLRLGHRRIGVISGPAGLTSTRDRLAGFRAALERAGVGLPDEQVVEGDFTREGGARGARELLDRVPGLTAIWALNDVMAVGALRALRERGRRVPEEVSLCGFDDIPLATDVTPELTTVHVPMVEMGARALRLALGPRHRQIRTEHLPVHVVARGTTGPGR